MKRQRTASEFLYRCILGTAGIGGVWDRIEPKESIDSIIEALEQGITAIDTAPAYGNAELFVGDALKRWKGPMPQISTKVGRLKSYAVDEGYYDYSPEGMEQSVTSSLKVLGIPVIDILFLHDPPAIPLSEVERVMDKMEEFKCKGYARRIGLGGNSHGRFKKYIAAGLFDVVMEFNRLDACCVDIPDMDLSDYESNGMEFFAASPLHMGLLGSRYNSFIQNPPAWLDKRSICRAKQIKEIAEKYAIPLPSLAHRFLLNIPHRFKIVIGATNMLQLQSTLADFAAGPLTCEIYEEIVDRNKLVYHE